jgi:hypothetical protein
MEMLDMIYSLTLEYSDKQWSEGSQLQLKHFKWNKKFQLLKKLAMTGSSRKCLPGSQQNMLEEFRGFGFQDRSIDSDTVAALLSVHLSWMKPVLKRDSRVGC